MAKSSAAVNLLGLPKYELPQLLRLVGRGFQFSALERLQRNSGLQMDEIIELVQLSRRTLTRRRQEGRFAADESDRLLRAARLLGKAIALLDGDTETASRWWRLPS